jgi:hypothetical protein
MYAQLRADRGKKQGPISNWPHQSGTHRVRVRGLDVEPLPGAFQDLEGLVERRLLAGDERDLLEEHRRLVDDRRAGGGGGGGA